jgi:hypothetical protein
LSPIVTLAEGKLHALCNPDPLVGRETLAPDFGCVLHGRDVVRQHRRTLDGLIVGRRYGLDPAAMLDVLNLSTGRNFGTEQTLRLCSLPRSFDSGHRISLLVKDLAGALRFARELGVGTELFELAHDDFAAALDNLGDGDVSALLRHWEQMAGEELPPSPAAAQPAQR